VIYKVIEPVSRCGVYCSLHVQARGEKESSCICPCLAASDAVWNTGLCIFAVCRFIELIFFFFVLRSTHTDPEDLAMLPL
jgi:hypothetical protein